jgi:very-short-patch-repair endonuclease
MAGNNLHVSSSAEETMKPSPAEILMSMHLKELGLEFDTEVPVCESRRWRWDFLLTESNVAIEVDGFFKGRHGAGWGADNEKRNVGTMMGYRVLVFSTKSVLKGEAKAFLQEHLGETMTPPGFPKGTK